MKPWKLQKFFGDVIYDLRNRGLLPVVVLLLIGMVAVPVVLSRGGSDSTAPATPAAVEQASDLAPENQRAVVTYNPGLRDYKKRLNELQAKDPFKQQFTNAGAAASALTSTVASGTATATATTETSGGGSTSTGSSGSPDPSGSSDSSGSGGSSSGGKLRVRYYSYQTDLSVGDISVPPTSRKKVSPFTYLPDPTVPVLVFLGPTGDGKAAIFLVSESVSSVSGPGSCFPAADQCQLMALRIGQTEDLVYDVDGKIYRIKVDRIKRVVSSKPPKG
jgi:hypothetical protein